MNQQYPQYPQYAYAPSNPYPHYSYPQQQQQQASLSHHQHSQTQSLANSQQQTPHHQQQQQPPPPQLHHPQQQPQRQSQTPTQIRPFRAGHAQSDPSSSDPQHNTFDQGRRQARSQTTNSVGLRNGRDATNYQKNARSPQPATPGPGPGAPPPDPSSPDNNLEVVLMSALQSNNGTNRRNTQEDQDEEDDEDQDGGQNGDENGPVFNLPPPPESIYRDENELEKAIHAWSLEHGYELVRRASKKNAAGKLYKRYYHCSKHGKIANTGKLTEKTRVRMNRKSNRMGCPMSLAAVAVDPQTPSGEWQIRLRKTHHNHGPLDAVTLAGHRRRARMGGVEKAVDGLFAIGTSTNQVLQFLQRTNPNGLFTRTDVANMKLKYNKFGTCVKDDDSRKAASGVPSACLTCRNRKRKCDSVRPTCGACAANSGTCQYDHDERSPEAPPQPLAGTVQTTPTEPQEQTTPTANQPNSATAQQILRDLQSFQTEHVRPTRLTLQSSSVEILAQSSCGNGDSYKIVPTLNSTGEWDAYSNGMIEASMKENTYDVLMGSKPEPIKPNDDCDVDDWNEYVKQTAIFNRRNAALLGAIWGTLAPPFRLRVQGYRNAHAVWHTLEDACQPRGSVEALKLYTDLTSITLQGCGNNLREYVARLENAFDKLQRLKLQNSSRRAGGRPSHMAPPPSIAHTPSSAAAGLTGPGSSLSADNVFPEDQMCFLFLKNLGPEYRHWASNLCMTCNVGGFGSGPKLLFKDVTRRAVEADAAGNTQQGGGNVVMNGN